MGLMDILFGEGPSVDTQTLDLLTPEQQRALRSLLSTLQGRVGRGVDSGLDANIDPSNLQTLSLEALENRARALGDPNTQSQLATSATDTLMRLLDFSSSGAEAEDFFRTNIRDPALQEFGEDVLPAIGRSFGGSNFFGSERRQADDSARQDLLESLTRARSGLQFQTAESAKNRALQALGLVPAVDAVGRGNTAELLKLLTAGESATGLSERNFARQFEQFFSERGAENQDIAQLLQALNTRALENVVTVNPGSQGIAGDIIQAVGAYYSDERLKENVQKLGEADGIALYTWDWNDKARELGIDHPTIGVMASEVEHIKGAVTTDENGYKVVNYGFIFGDV